MIQKFARRYFFYVLLPIGAVAMIWGIVESIVDRHSPQLETPITAESLLAEQNNKQQSVIQMIRSIVQASAESDQAVRQAMEGTGLSPTTNVEDAKKQYTIMSATLQAREDEIRRVAMEATSSPDFTESDKARLTAALRQQLALCVELQNALRTRLKRVYETDLAHVP